MSIPALHRPDESYLCELRLFLEEICCNLFRLRYAKANAIAPEDVRIQQEYSLGVPNAFADIRIHAKGAPAYFVEVDYGYTSANTVESLARKYGRGGRLGAASKLFLIGDAKLAADWKTLEPQIRSLLPQQLDIEFWDEKKLLAMVRDSFGVEADSISENGILELRKALDIAEGRYAFEETFNGDSLQRALIWHYGFWQLKRLRKSCGLTSTTILPPGTYPGTVSVLADLCGFSGYVKETKEDSVIRHCLSTFYSKARSAILANGGMMYQFVGDEVIGLFGIPDRTGAYLEAAFDCAGQLASIGESVSQRWQRQLDCAQKARGVHVGICMGTMQIVSLRPFSRTHISGIGDVINLAARLLGDAGPGQIVASNAYYQALSPAYQAAFREAPPVEAKNMGTVLAWRADLVHPAVRQEWSQPATRVNSGMDIV
jgi:class 3 adenylate cyclase